MKYHSHSKFILFIQACGFITLNVLLPSSKKNLKIYTILFINYSIISQGSIMLESIYYLFCSISDDSFYYLLDLYMNIKAIQLKDIT